MQTSMVWSQGSSHRRLQRELLCRLPTSVRARKADLNDPFAYRDKAVKITLACRCCEINFKYFWCIQILYRGRWRHRCWMASPDL